MVEQEAQGVDLWTDQFDDKFRTKVLHALDDVGGYYRSGPIAAEARRLILRDEGLFHLASNRYTDIDDFRVYVQTCPDEDMPTCIEAIYVAFNNLKDGQSWNSPEEFAELCRTALREHRISFDFVADQMVEFSSMEMHDAVVSPVLTLLSGRSDFDSAELAYRDALDEIADGKPGDAITDAGTALQETLTALGCEGNALGPLIKSAKNKGIIAAHDLPMIDALDKVMNWVSADRSTYGDAHAATTSTVEDAWFIVHITGAVILRLSQGGRSGAQRRA
ncbi:hypothetical protein ACTWLI_07660 [Arthrobacter sp. Hor0625]|uniref:hypothetical protein n=1 Tax=Arthrobacter sp. Hor0625 TaxID=3457358 RepID=UPI00403EB128